jgi:hypothetical protein
VLYLLSNFCNRDNNLPGRVPKFPVSVLCKLYVGGGGGGATFVSALE